MRLGHTSMSPSVLRRKGSSQACTGLAVALDPRAFPKFSLNLIWGGFLQASNGQSPVSCCLPTKLSVKACSQPLCMKEQPSDAEFHRLNAFNTCHQGCKGQAWRERRSRANLALATERFPTHAGQTGMCLVRDLQWAA